MHSNVHKTIELNREAILCATESFDVYRYRMIKIIGISEIKFSSMPIFYVFLLPKGSLLSMVLLIRVPQFFLSVNIPPLIEVDLRLKEYILQYHRYHNLKYDINR